jgi:hypothetical protein
VAVLEEFSELPHVEEFILGAAIVTAYGVFLLPAIISRARLSLNGS